MSKNIEHKGEIIEITPETIVVEILSKAACNSCVSKSACMVGESESKIVEVDNHGYQFFEIGETVNVVLKRSLGFKALWLSYVIPLIILLVLLVSLSGYGISELIIGLVIILSLAVYYFLIYLFRDKLKKEFIFTIEKLNQ